MLLFWIIIIVGIMAHVRGIFSRYGGGTPSAPEGSLEILSRRCAKGEINKAAFEEKKDILGS